jgi:hypothetical protein
MVALRLDASPHIPAANNSWKVDMMLVLKPSETGQHATGPLQASALTSAAPQPACRKPPNGICICVGELKVASKLMLTTSEAADPIHASHDGQHQQSNTTPWPLP